jgi:hypothetical protein
MIERFFLHRIDVARDYQISHLGVENSVKVMANPANPELPRTQMT